MSGDFRDIEYRRLAVAPAWALWLMLVTCLSMAVFLAVSLRRPEAPGGRRAAAISGQPTFEEAASAMREGRFAAAYGRFVTLADDGDAEAAQVALFMHRFGPRVFGSAWDASVPQVEAWMDMTTGPLPRTRSQSAAIEQVSAPLRHAQPPPQTLRR